MSLSTGAANVIMVGLVWGGRGLLRLSSFVLLSVSQYGNCPYDVVAGSGCTTYPTKYQVQLPILVVSSYSVVWYHSNSTYHKTIEVMLVLFKTVIT